MADYKPSAAFNVPLKVYKPTYETRVGVKTKIYPETGFEIFGTFKTFGGTDLNVNGIYSVIDTAEIETWYRPDITSDCQIELVETGERYEVLGKPENIGRRNQYLKIKVQSIEGGA